MGYGKTYKTKWLEDLSGNQGTANQVLISTSAGIAWATASTIIGGPYLPLSGGTMTGNTTHGDNVRSLYGASSDLQVYHDGSNSYVRDVGTGRLWIDSNGEGVSIISDGSGSTPMANFYKDGAVELYHNNVRRFRTNDLGGVSVSHTSGSLGNSFFGAVSGASNGFQIANSSSNEITYTFQNGSNSQVLKILNNGNVGIGTTSPTNKLDIRQSSSGGSDTLGNGAISIGSDNTYWSFRGTTTSLQDLAFDRYYAGTWYEAMRIQRSTGNVGIGTTSPTEKLEVNGNIQISDSDGYLQFNDTNAASGNRIRRIYNGEQNLYFSRRNDDGTLEANDMTITSSGNVGIGTTAPSAKLHIESTTATGANLVLETTHSGGIPLLDLKGAHSAQLRYKDELDVIQGRIDFEDSGTFNFIDVPNNSSTLYLKTGGNVGIGTTSPSEKLEVDGKIKAVHTDDSYATYGGNGVFFNRTDSYLSPLTDNTSTLNVGYDGGKWGNVEVNGSTIKFENGADERMRITSTGNVGIGTTSPVGKLDISAGTNLNTRFRQLALDNYSDEGIGITFSRTSSDSELMALGVLDTDKFGLFSRNGLIFATGGASNYEETQEAMRIDSTGNVGIGTENIGTNDKLLIKTSVDNSVAQGLVIQRSANTDEGYINYNGGGFQFRSTDGDPIVLGQVSNERFRIDSSGNVGIGTTSPSDILHTYGSSNTTARFESSDSDSHIRINDTDDSFYLGTANQKGYIGSTIGSPEINIDLVSGNVGIGTTSPAQNLHVNSSSSFSASYAKFSNAETGIAGGDGFDVGVNTGAEAVIWQRENSNLLLATNNTERMRITSSGNVGIGTTSPTFPLDVVGDGIKLTRNSKTFIFNADFASAGTHANIQCDAGMGLSFSTNASEKMRILGGGNVGIGTDNPDAKLDVLDTTTAVTGKMVDFRSYGDAVLKVWSDYNDNSNADSYGLFGNGISTGDNPEYSWHYGVDASDSAFKIGYNVNSWGVVGTNDNFVILPNGNVGIGTTSPAASALLDVASTTKGVLLPRMSTTQINAISSPAEGLTVYNTVLSTLCFFNGISWQKVTSTAM